MDNNHGTFRGTTDFPRGYYYYDSIDAFEVDCLFFSNRKGELTKGTVEELPPPLLHAYNTIFSLDTGSYCYLVRFNGKYGVMLDNEFDKAYLKTKNMDMEEGLRAICEKAKEFSLRKKFRDTLIVVAKDSSLDSHVLSVICKPMMAKDDFNKIAKILRNEVYEISKPETLESVAIQEKSKDESIEGEIKKLQQRLEILQLIHESDIILAEYEAISNEIMETKDKLNQAECKLKENINKLDKYILTGESLTKKEREEIEKEKSTLIGLDVFETEELEKREERLGVLEEILHDLRYSLARSQTL